MFCVECGKKGKTYNGLCLDCYIKRYKFFDFPSEIKIEFCKSCNSYKINNQWKKGDIHKDIEEYLKKNVRAEIKHEIFFDKNNILKIKGFFEGRHIEVKKEIKVKERYVTCPKCSLKKGGYYEAIIQVRGAYKKRFEEVDELIKKRVEERESYIMKIEDVRGGKDYYIGNKKVAERIAKEIKDDFSGILKSSKSLVGVKDGNRIYRYTYSIRFLEYEGKFIKIDGKVYKVKPVGKKLELHGINGEVRNVYREEIKNAVEMDIEEREATLLHEEKDTLYVMDSKSFRTFVVNKPKKWKGEKNIKIIEYEGKIYAVDGDE
ncbi:MAG TPA: hypothetical protein ENI53_00200 [Thermoplasmatales archaeon]|nr:hypothetical protein [Thermoplasmatales archaeon]